ncbi:MAG: hypothetical protein NT158_07730 [Cyanobacteria bacterium]|nr:hypothetical protein [Cyanobacteriota bacterium]
MVSAPWPARDAEHLLVTGAQLQDLEKTLFASGLPVEALMEKAGLAISRRLLKVLKQPAWQRLAAGGIVVLVGPGHNGGDGLVVARELHLAGLAVRLWRPYPTQRPLTAAHWRHGRWLGLPELSDPPDPCQPHLWVDAIFGIGQHRPPGETVGRDSAPGPWSPSIAQPACARIRAGVSARGPRRPPSPSALA